MKPSSVVALVRASVLLAALALGIGTALAALPTEQQAIVQNGTGGADVLKLESVPGSDVAGTVAAVGSAVTELKVGQSVFCMKGFGPGVSGLNGAYSHYIVVSADDVVPKPRELTYEQAAGLGMVGWTGARTMDEAKVGRGERVLITGIAGGVGSSAAQIAVARGAQVIGTATPRHLAYLRSIGVTKVLDYRNADWATQARDMDVVLDTVGGPTTLEAFGAVRRGGVFISVASTEVEHRQITAEKCAAAGVICPEAGAPRRGAMIPIGELLQQVAALARAGKFTIHIDKTYPLAEAGQAQEYNRAGHTEGKVILTVTAQADSR